MTTHMYVLVWTRNPNPHLKQVLQVGGVLFWDCFGIAAVDNSDTGQCFGSRFARASLVQRLKCTVHDIETTDL